MTQLTEQEIKLQQKYAELRKKKELKRKQAEDAKATADAKGTAVSRADALDKAKAILAKKSDAQNKPPSSSECPAGPKVDPILAAKRALEEKKKGSAAAKRPTLKRPTAQRPTPKSTPNQEQIDASSSPHSTQTSHQVIPAHRPAKRQAGDDVGRSRPSAREEPSEDHRQKRPRYDKEEPAPSRGHAEDGAGATLFVGDLPPYYTNEDLYHVFANLGEIEDIRVMGSQCYAFVRFQDPATAEGLVHRFSRKPLIASGHELRINLAHGQLPDWKRGPDYERGHIPRGQPHPKVMQAQQHGDALAQQLLAAGSHGLDFSARPCEREMVSYDDL